MKYRYRFKNSQLEKAVFALFDEKSIKAAIDRQMDNVSNIISLANCWPKENKTKIHEELQENIGIIGRIDFAKSEIGVIREYDPKGWNPYPEITPPESKQYLVQIRKKGISTYLIVERDSIFSWEKLSVIAFRELPEMYEPESDDET